VRHACGYALANKGHDTRALQACGPQKHPSTQGVTPNYCQGASKISGATRPSERVCPYAEANSDVVVIVPAPRRQANCARDTNMNTNTFVRCACLTYLVGFCSATAAAALQLERQSYFVLDGDLAGGPLLPPGILEIFDVS
jgi:hypothetical protein